MEVAKSNCSTVNSLRERCVSFNLSLLGTALVPLVTLLRVNATAAHQETEPIKIGPVFASRIQVDSEQCPTEITREDGDALEKEGKVSEAIDALLNVATCESASAASEEAKWFSADTYKLLAYAYRELEQPNLPASRLFYARSLQVAPNNTGTLSYVQRLLFTVSCAFCVVRNVERKETAGILKEYCSYRTCELGTTVLFFFPHLCTKMPDLFF